MTPPLIIVNFKCFPEATGRKALDLAQSAEEISLERDVNIIVAPQAIDLKTIVEHVSIPVFAQHFDSVSPGSFTGHITAESLKEAGVSGVIINHSEKPLSFREVRSAICRAGEVGLIALACSDTTSESVATAKLWPDLVAVEPPELIGGGVSVSKARPDVVRRTVDRIRKVNRDVVILCGAGISSGNDVSSAIALGTEGVLVATGVVKAKNQRKALDNFAEALTTRQRAPLGKSP